MKKLWLIIIVFLVGCDAFVGDVQSLNETHKISCYSGGKEVFYAETTGYVNSLEGGGWAFKTKDGRFVKTFADCFVWFNL